MSVGARRELPVLLDISKSDHSSLERSVTSGMQQADAKNARSVFSEYVRNDYHIATRYSTAGERAICAASIANYSHHWKNRKGGKGSSPNAYVCFKRGVEETAGRKVDDT